MTSRTGGHPSHRSPPRSAPAAGRSCCLCTAMHSFHESLRKTEREREVGRRTRRQHPRVDPLPRLERRRLGAPDPQIAVAHRDGVLAPLRIGGPSPDVGRCRWDLKGGSRAIVVSDLGGVGGEGQRQLLAARLRDLAARVRFAQAVRICARTKGFREKADGSRSRSRRRSTGRTHSRRRG